MKISVMILMCFMGMSAQAQVPGRVPEYQQDVQKVLQYFVTQADKYLPQPQRKRKDEQPRKRRYRHA